MVNCYISNLVSILNYSIQTKRIYCRIEYTKLGERLISLLFTHGYILSYRIINNKGISYIYIQLKKTNSFNPLLKIQLISKPTNIICWSHERLIRECTRSGSLTQFVLSTTEGFLFSKDAINTGLGGKILFKIN